jgi:replicative DNA helicase
MTPTATAPHSLSHNEDAEKALLCSLIQRPSLLDELGGAIKKESFYTPAHGTVFERLPALYARDGHLDFLALKRELERDQLLDEVGGAQALDEIWAFVPTAANWRYYADQVQEAYVRRSVSIRCRALDQLMLDPATDMASAVTGTVEETLTSLSMSVSTPPKDTRERLKDLLEEFEARALGQTPAGITTGIGNLDARLLPFKEGNNVVISAPTSEGKSALAVQIATHAAECQNKVVAIFSFEMSVEEILERQICGLGEINNEHLSRGLLTHQEFNRITDASRRLHELLETKLFIVDDASTMQSVISKCRQIQVKAGSLDLVVIDYLQLLTPEAKRNADRREREVAEDSRKFKRAATTMKFVGMAISQLNDDGQIRESRAVEHDCDCHLQISADPDSNPDTDRFIEIKKQRNGARNLGIPVTFEGQYMRFSPRVRQTVAK